jgi:hypothetical protein
MNATPLLWGLLVLPILLSAVCAQQEPRACITKDHEPPPGGLPSTPPVVFDRPQIIHRQKSYYIKIFSDTAPKPGQRFDQCFRYEVENEGPVMNAFYWELADQWWLDPIKKAERHSRKIVRPVDDEPRVIDTRISAFGNDSAQTRAWAAVSRPKGTTAEHASVRFETVSPDSIAGLSDFLKAHDLPLRPLTAFYLNESGQSASTLEDVYSGPRINIVLQSNAIRDGNEITIRTEITAKGEASAEARYFMPALFALRPLEKPADTEAFNEFVRRYRELWPQSSPYRPVWEFPIKVPAASLAKSFIP